MDVIPQLEFELAYYDSAVYRFNHYTTKTPLKDITLHESGTDKGVHTISKSFNQEVNVIAQSEIELAYNDVLVQNASH